MKHRDQVEPLLKRAVEFLTEDYLLPEYVDIKSFGGSVGVGASILAASDLILLFEDRENLVLFSGIPDDWFTSKRPLIMEDLCTTHGYSSIEIGSSANQYQLEINMENIPEEIEFHVPPSVPLPMVKAYGSTIVERVSKSVSPFLRVVPHSNEVVLTFHK